MVAAGLDGGADRVDPRAVLGPEEPGVFAERPRHIPGLGCKRVEEHELFVERVEVDGGGIGRDRALRERRGVPRGRPP